MKKYIARYKLMQNYAGERPTLADTGNKDQATFVFTDLKYISPYDHIKRSLFKHHSVQNCENVQCNVFTRVPQKFCVVSAYNRMCGKKTVVVQRIFPVEVI